MPATPTSFAKASMALAAPNGPASNRELNRWTLARQFLLERVQLDAATAIERLAGMQAQYPSSPYIALWSRLEGFQRSDLEAALRGDRVVKTTVMRGTLHLVPTNKLAHYRVGAGSSYYDRTARQLAEHGVDLEAIRAAVLEAVADRPHSRLEISQFISGLLPPEAAELAAARPSAIAGLSVATDLCNLPQDAAFGYSGGSRYRIAPPVPTIDPTEATRVIAHDYLGAYGPASTADLAYWSGRSVRSFAPALDQLDLVSFTAEDGRTLLDLADAPRPPADTTAPVRFLSKWDSILLSYVRRERIFPDGIRSIVIRPNGDVKPTFLVDGMVAGKWDAPFRGKTAVITLEPLIPVACTAAVEDEALKLLQWLRPDAKSHDVRWLSR
jgi:hypothetical protein